MGYGESGLATGAMTAAMKPFVDVVQLSHAMKGVFMSVCVPVRSMKNTAEFAELVERERDVTVTKNGCEVFHCLSEEQYRAMQDEVVRARLLSHVMRAERELAAGAYDDYDGFAAAVREEYGL